jgi:hypothetical protein
MRDYISKLRWPDNWVDFVDLISKTIVAAAAALIAAGVWLYKQEQEAAEKALSAKADAQKVDFDRRLRLLSESMSENADKRQNIELFLNVLPKDVNDQEWRLKTQSLSAYCVEQSKGLGAGQRPPLLAMLCDANAQRTVEFASTVTLGVTTADASNAAVYVQSPTATAQVSKLAAVEAASSGSSSDKWYAVVASIPITQPNAAAELAKSLNRELAAVTRTCDVRIYQTRISHSFAITSGGEKSEADAKARVNLIRGAGAVADAFAQPDRGWTLATGVPQPVAKKTPPCN